VPIAVKYGALIRAGCPWRRPTSGRFV